MNSLSQSTADLLKNDLLVDTSPIMVAAVNAESELFDLQAGLVKADRITSAAKDAGAILVVFPELWLPGFINGSPVGKRGMPPKPFKNYLDNSLEEGTPEWHALLKIAKDHQVYLSIGIAEKNIKEKHLYMTQLLIGPNGTVLDKRSKINPSGDERNYFSDVPMNGNLRVVNTPLGRIGQLSCGEHFRAHMTFNMMAQAENIHIAAWPYNIVEGEGVWWEKYHMNMINSAYYAENSGAWTILAAVGRSAIFNADGEIVVEADNCDSDFAIAEIDRSAFNSISRKNSYYTYNIISLIKENYPQQVDSDAAVEELNQPDVTKVE